jgi:hypothetical protein
VLIHGQPKYSFEHYNTNTGVLCCSGLQQKQSEPETSHFSHRGDRNQGTSIIVMKRPKFDMSKPSTVF